MADEARHNSLLTMAQQLLKIEAEKRRKTSDQGHYTVTLYFRGGYISTIKESFEKTYQ